jgi:hypothetical protein
MTPIIIAVAITGSVPRKKDNPAVPVTPAEQIESTHEAFEGGLPSSTSMSAIRTKAPRPTPPCLPKSKKECASTVPA